MSFSFVSQAYAASSIDACWLRTSPGIARGVATISGIECVIQAFLQPLPALIALAAVGMLVLAGIRLMSAGSEPKAVAAAWNMFTYAIIGLILLAVVWLVLVIIQNFTGAEVTKFGLPN